MIDHHRSKIVAGPNEEICCPSARQPLHARKLARRDVLELCEAYTTRPHHWRAWFGISRAGASRRGR
ncbi:unnamed protein product [Fusarium venenatum]|uniref:Uncharacterized protein n=1 Tax=Fusarium venenatum TaxID=56646 RepID=A0A2L2TLQ1_9HYPO|nr:uncharacterized protein FVRRES_02009 [Fusarium venenatum]CEI65497.1 unnamed protein product [Fusarium venenatum]